MPIQTPAEHAQAILDAIDAAPAEPGGEPAITSNEDVARGIIEGEIALAQTQAAGDCPAQLAECQAQLAQAQAELAEALETIQAMRPWVRGAKFAAKGIREILILEQGDQEAQTRAKAEAYDRAQQAQREAQAKVVQDVAEEAGGAS